MKLEDKIKIVLQEMRSDGNRQHYDTLKSAQQEISDLKSKLDKLKIYEKYL